MASVRPVEVLHKDIQKVILTVVIGNWATKGFNNPHVDKVKGYKTIIMTMPSCMTIYKGQCFESLTSQARSHWRNKKRGQSLDPILKRTLYMQLGGLHGNDMLRKCRPFHRVARVEVGGSPLRASFTKCWIHSEQSASA